MRFAEPVIKLRKSLFVGAVLLSAIASISGRIARNRAAILTSHAILGPGYATSAALAALTGQPREWLWRGSIALKRGETSLAVVTLEEALRRAPTDAMTIILLGEAYDQAGQGERAIAVWKQAGASSRLADLGDRAAHVGHWDQAIEAWQAAWEMSTQEPGVARELAMALYQVRRDTAAAERLLQQEIAGQPVVQESIELRLVLAKIFESEGRWTEAFEVYSEVAALSPNDMRAHTGRGRVLFYGLGQVDAALREFAVTVQLAPDNATGYLETGRIYQARQQYTEAVAWYRRAAEVEPGSPWPWAAQAEALLAAGDAQGAIAVLTVTAARFPSEPHIFYLLSCVYW